MMNKLPRARLITSNTSRTPYTFLITILFTIVWPRAAARARRPRRCPPRASTVYISLQLCNRDLAVPKLRAKRTVLI